jgi:hypothetical protein
MNLFRSEEHVAQWLAQNGYGAGATIGSAKLGDLAHAWWCDRLAPDWQPHTREQNQSILDGLGLSGEFWRL